MRKLLFVFLPVICITSAFAQKQKVYDYIDKYKNIAMEEMQRTGVPAAITLAQGILESGCGQSELATTANNHFGIKCKENWTGGTAYHDDDRRQECFRAYPTAEDSYKDHSDFLKNRPYYTNLFLLNPTDYKGWAYGLKKAGYATEKDYPQSLISIIETYHLEDYSDYALGKKINPENDRYAVNSSDNTNAYATVKSTNVAIPVNSNAPQARVAQTRVALPAYPVSEFYINNTKVIFAPKGSSLLALASKFNIDYNNLLKLNDLKNEDILPEGKVVYLQKKADKGNKDFHVTSYGETLREVSDKEAVSLKKLIEYNHISADAKLTDNQNIGLKDKINWQLKTIDN